MAAPMIMSNFSKISQKLFHTTSYSRYANQSVRGISFWKKKDEGKNQMEKTPESETDIPFLSEERSSDIRMQSVTKIIKSYKPPEDLEDQIHMNVQQICGDIENWKTFKLDNRRTKFRLLTKLMSELDHNIPNYQLNKIKTVGDALEYFKVEVRDTNLLEDIASDDLPKNLHLQLDALKLGSDMDTMFQGKSAFSSSKSQITSLRRKHRSNYKDGKRLY